MGGGKFSQAVDYETSNPTWVAVGDLNGDGKDDLVASNGDTPTNLFVGSVSVFAGNGDGTFQTAVNYAVGANPTGIVAASTAHIHGSGRRLDGGHSLAHRARRAGDLGDGWTADRKRRQECAHANIANSTGHHGGEGACAFRCGEVLTCRQPFQQRGEFPLGFAHAALTRGAVRASLRKFCSSAWPWADAILSG